MKFLCSVLILAGAVALIDAFPHSESEVKLRLETDRWLLEHMTAEMGRKRDFRTVECGNTYLQELTKCLNQYNSDTQACQEKRDSIDADLNEEAKEKMSSINSNVTAACSKACPMENPNDALSCTATKANQYSSVLLELASEVETYIIELNNRKASADNDRKMCNQEADNVYLKASTDAANNRKTCEAASNQ